MRTLNTNELSMVSGGAQGYWMENYTGYYNWIPTSSKEFSDHSSPGHASEYAYIATTEAGIHHLTADGGNYSRGGYFKWE